MRTVFLFACCAATLFPLVGCSKSNQGTVATTDEDEMAAYEAIINQGEGEGEEDQVEDQ